MTVVLTAWLAQSPTELEDRACEAIDGFAFPTFKRGDVRPIFQEIGNLPSEYGIPIQTRLLAYVAQAIQSTRDEIESARKAAASAPRPTTESQWREVEVQIKRADILMRRLTPLIEIVSELGATLKEPQSDFEIPATAMAYQALELSEARSRLVESMSDTRTLCALVSVETDATVVLQIARRLQDKEWTSDSAAAVFLKHASDMRNGRRLRSECAKALVDSAGPSAVPGLIKLLKDPAAESSARRALLRITGNHF